MDEIKKTVKKYEQANKKRLKEIKKTYPEIFKLFSKNIKDMHDLDKIKILKIAIKIEEQYGYILKILKIKR